MRSVFLLTLLVFTTAHAATAPVETRIPMRDGKTLAADVYVPREGERFPAILIQTPYDKTGMRPWFQGEGRWGEKSLFTSQRYAFVVVDWRGRFGSRDALIAGVRPGGSEDGFDAVKWVAAQPWSNGKVGTWGPSALGAAQYRTAVAQPPALDCSVPVVMPLNLGYDVYFKGGVMWEEFARTLGRLGWPVYDQLAANPTHTRFWDAVERMNGMRAEDIQVPMLLVGGWFDIYVDDVLATFQQLRTGAGPATRERSRLIIGPWLHNTDQVTNGELEFPLAQHRGIARAERFLDACLLAKPEEPAPASITYYQMGSDEWRASETWPPPGLQETTLFLGKGGALGQQVGDEASATWRYDPASPVPTYGGHVLTPELSAGPRDVREKVESRADVLTFTSDALTQPLELAGRAAARLFVSTDRPDTDVTVWLTDVFPDGRSMMLSEGIQRLRYRNGTDREQPMTPGEIVEITVPVTHLAYTFLPGHRVRLLVSSSNFPKFARNLNDGGAQYKEGGGLVATNNVHLGKARPSSLLLPTHAPAN